MSEGFDYEEKTTRLYGGDLTALQQRQREESARQKRWISQAELLHEMLTPLLYPVHEQLELKPG